MPNAQTLANSIEKEIAAEIDYIDSVRLRRLVSLHQRAERERAKQTPYLPKSYKRYRASKSKPFAQSAKSSFLRDRKRKILQIIASLGSRLRWRSPHTSASDKYNFECDRYSACQRIFKKTDPQNTPKIEYLSAAIIASLKAQDAFLLAQNQVVSEEFKRSANGLAALVDRVSLHAAVGVVDRMEKKIAACENDAMGIKIIPVLQVDGLLEKSFLILQAEKTERLAALEDTVAMALETLSIAQLKEQSRQDQDDCFREVENKLQPIYVELLTHLELLKSAELIASEQSDLWLKRLEGRQLNGDHGSAEQAQTRLTAFLDSRKTLLALIQVFGESKAHLASKLERLQKIRTMLNSNAT